MTRSFTAVVNPHAGGPRAGAARLDAVAARLRAAGAGLAVEHSRSLPHAVEVATAAAAAGHVVLAVGGDGMTGAVGGALAGTGAVLGLVPTGRGNDFARALRLPADPDELARLLLTGAPRSVDAIDVAGTAVLGSVYAGVDALANRYANHSRLRGPAAYYLGGLRAIAGWRPVDYRITVDGGVHERRGFTVVAANSGFYGHGRQVAPGAVLDDGLLDVIVIKEASKLLFFAVMRELAHGSHVDRPQVEVLRGREVRIAADRELPYGADGELPGVLPVTATVMPGALRVLAP